MPKSDDTLIWMGKYYYRARTRKGEIIQGAVIADTEWNARKILSKQNQIPLEISRFNFRLFFSDLNSKVETLTQSVSLEEKITLMSQIEMGISVGIPLVQMLNFLQNDATNSYTRQVLAKISADITEGGTLHEAFARHPAVFDSTIVGLIKTGEVTGKLDETLARISLLLEQQAENRAKVKSATFYPKIVLFTLVAVVGIVVYFVIPKLKTFLKTLGADLPPVTLFVLGISDFFIAYWYLVAGLALAVRHSFKRAIATEKGKRMLDRFVLSLPVLGKLFIYLELNNFSVILDLLITSGVPLLESLATLKASQKNQLFREALTTCEEEVSRGGTLTKAMEKHPIFPGTFRNLIGIGEETGRLPPILRRLGKHYQVQLDYLLDNLSKAIEPILLFIIFLAVLVLSIAVFLPIWKMNSAIRPRG